MTTIEQNSPDIAQFGISAAHGSLAFVTGSLIKAVVTLLLIIVLARLLQPAGIGLYTIVIAFYSILETGGYFGLATAIRQKLPGIKENEMKVSVISNGFLISLGIGLLLLFILLGASNFIAINLYKNPALILPIEISALAIPLSLISSLTNSSLLGLMKGKEAGINFVLFSIVYLLSSTALVLLGYGVAGAVSGLAIGYLASCVMSIYYLRKFIGFTIVKPVKKIGLELVKFSVPVFISTTSSTLTVNFGIAFLALFVTTSITGNYGVAFRVGSFADTILIATTTVLLPTFAQLFSDKNLNKNVGIAFNGSIYYTLIFLLPLLAYVTSVSIPFVGILFGYSFSSAPLYLSLVAFGITIGIIGRYAATMILGYGDAKKFMVYQIITTIAQIVLIVILVPYWNVLGLILALYILGSIILDVVYFRALIDQFHFKLELGKIIRILAASLILAGVLFLVSFTLNQRPFILIINGLILLIIYPPLLAFLRGIELKDIAFMRKVVEKLWVLEPVALHMINYMQRFVKK